MRVLALVALGAAGLFAAESQDLSESRIDEIIQKFAAKEAAFSLAREDYTYRQSAKIQVLDDAGNAREKWETVSDIVFLDGKRSEHVVHAPVSTLQSILLTPEDMVDIRSVQPFVLTTKDLPKYFIRYLGKQTLDEIPCYVFAVKPKKLESGQRYFSGEVWVDDQELQIVKSYGRGLGQLKHSEDNQFPKFETYREQIDGKFWFPTYSIANDTLHFKENDVRIRQTVKYEDYKRFKAESTITFGGAADDPKTEPAPAPVKKP